MQDGLLAITLSLAAMLFYIWIRFEWQFSLGAIIALVHDVIITVGILITFSMTASAGLINTTENSFIDENSSLEWMDFGVNNTDTYDFVSSQLGNGQAYEGWRLATIDEVYNMYSNTFLKTLGD